MQNLFQDLGKKRLSTKKFHEIIVEAFFISTMNGDCLNAIHMQKKCYFHATAAAKQTTTVSINAFNNRNTHFNDKFLDVSSYLLCKSVIGLQKISKTSKKYFGGRPRS